MPTTFLNKLATAQNFSGGQIQIASPPGLFPDLALAYISLGRHNPPTPIGRIVKYPIHTKVGQIVVDRTNQLKWQYLGCLALMSLEEHREKSTMGHIARLQWRPNMSSHFEPVPNSHVVYPIGIDVDDVWEAHLALLEEKFYIALRAHEEKRARLALLNGDIRRYKAAVEATYDIRLVRQQKTSRFSKVYYIVRRDGLTLAPHDWAFLKRHLGWVGFGPTRYNRTEEADLWVVPTPPTARVINN